jgi:hypothetical protein
VREEEELASSWPQILLAVEALRLQMPRRLLMPEGILLVLETLFASELSPEELGIDLEAQRELEFRGG